MSCCRAPLPPRGGAARLVHDDAGDPGAEPRLPIQPRTGERLWFLVPGDLATPTGGYRYDRRIIEGLRGLGWSVEHRALDPSFPQPTPEALDQTAALLAGIPDGEPVVDGLAFGALPRVAERQGGRLRLIALVHHPLWLETGLHARRAQALHHSETRALAQARRIIVTSRRTARLLEDQGIRQERIRVVSPGVDPAAEARGSGGPDPCLLCVATLTPRKGHDVLLRALARLKALPWRLTCVGSLERDGAWSAAMARLSRDLGLGGRVRFTGAQEDQALREHYRKADLLVLPTRYEGYGMVAAEALARGLPVVASRTGALAELVPPQAGILVPPDDIQALSEALRLILEDPGLRRRLAAGSRAVGLALPGWPAAARAFSDACRCCR